MPRPRKRRVVCALPRQNLFGPLNVREGARIQAMTVDEYETIRLIDGEGLSQEECAARMDVARTTVQRIYAEARQKLAASLVDGVVLKIEGGDYRLCEGLDGAIDLEACRICCEKRQREAGCPAKIDASD